MNTTCVCCGQTFDGLPKLMQHMATQHTSEEIIRAAGGDEHKTKLVPKSLQSATN
jgi:hypothetical protein